MPCPAKHYNNIRKNVDNILTSMYSSNTKNDKLALFILVSYINPPYIESISIVLVSMKWRYQISPLLKMNNLRLRLLFALICFSHKFFYFFYKL